MSSKMGAMFNEVVLAPDGLHPPLPVNTDTVLTFPVAIQRFKPVNRCFF
jgi:hypothetical protein